MSERTLLALVLAGLGTGCGGSASLDLPGPHRDAGNDAATSDATVGDDAGDGDAQGDSGPADGEAIVFDGGCDGVSGGIYYVDPQRGSDGATSTGSQTAGGQTTAGCAFKTLTHALAVVGAPAAVTRITVLGDATLSAGETFPFVIPQNVTVQGQGTVTVAVPAQQTTDAGAAPANGFVLAHPLSSLDTLTIDGQSLGGAAGVLVTSGSDATTVLRNVTVKNLPAGDGVQVSGSGVVTLDTGVVLTQNLVGLALSGTAGAISGNVDTGHPVAFTHNTQAGVRVSGSASMTFAGSAGTLGSGSIVASDNAAGFAMAQTGPGVVMPASTLRGVVAWHNSASGLDLQGGSRLLLRDSYVGANSTGVYVHSSSTSSNDTAYIDLGSPSDFGRNTLQSPSPADGGASAQNTGAGLCFSIQPNSSQTLIAIGNFWVDGAGTSTLDCSATTAGQLSLSSACNGASDVAGAGVQLSGSSGKNIVDVSNCSL
jgi:hypothetical protein